MTTSRRRTRAALALAVLLAPVLLSACSSDEEAAELTAAEQLAAAKAVLDETPGVRIRLSTPELPPGINGLVSAEGVGTHAPAFDGDIKVTASGIAFDAEVTAVDGVVYAKLPFTTSFEEIVPADYGAPDPAALMEPEGGLSSLLTAATNVEAGERVRDGGVVLSRFTADVPGTAVAAVIPSASADATFEGSFTLDESRQLNQVTLTGPFYPDAADVTYTIEFSQYGVEQDIQAP